MSDLEPLLRHLVDCGGSDLIVKAGSPPHVRVGGHLEPAPFEPVDPADVPRLLAGVVPRARAEELEEQGETEFAYGMAGLGRFRVAAYRQRGTLALTFHRVLPGLPQPGELGLPPILDRLTAAGRGLVLVSGPAASGVTTTLCALVDQVNESQACHVVTVEQPVEFLHADKRAVICQREVGSDTGSVAEAVRRASRQSADVVAVGTVEDAETLRAVIAAAEAGALVFAVVSALSAPEALVRLLEAFPEGERRQVRVTLASVLRAVLAQRLLERADGKGRVAAFEVLLNTSKVEDCIVEDRLSDLGRLISDGEYRGMQTLDRALEHLARDGLVSVRDAVSAANDPEELRLALGSLGSAPGFGG